jgi:hypothetical protein
MLLNCLFSLFSFSSPSLGFDLVKDTPVEAFQIIFCGAVEYLFQDFMKILKGAWKNNS